MLRFSSPHRDGFFQGNSVRLILSGALGCFLFFMFLFYAITPALATDGKKLKPEKLVVVIDKDYPPYIFQDGDGNLQGILVDQWKLWEQKTGVRVVLKGMEWGLAQETLQQGEADVIDTIFKTKERELIYGFSKPHTTIEVPIFFHRHMGGIVDASSVRGFVVGVKRGDACIDFLKKQGVTNFKEYANYEEIVKAAGKEEICVFCVDKPPALYHLYRMGLEREYRFTESLYSGQFHCAVMKENQATLALVNDGLSKITDAERAAIEQKWMGNALRPFPRKVFWALGYTAAGSVLLLLLFALWNRSLRTQVDKKTVELSTALGELRESELRLMEMIEHSPLATGVCDDKLNILLLNRRFVETFGYTLEDLPNLEQWWQYCHPDIEEQKRSREAWAAFIARASAGDTETFSREVRIRCKDKTFRIIEVASAPIGNRFVTVFNDITARKEAEAEQRRLEEQMQQAQKLESLGVLAGGIAHDFNNIMMAVLGNADLALMEMPPTAAGRKYMVEIEKASLKAADLCRQMLAYAGAQTFVLEPHDIASVVQEMQHMLEVSMSKKIHLNLLFPPDVPPVMVDITQLRQVVMNLVINAAEAIGDRNGSVTIATAVENCDRDYLDMVRMDTPLPEGRYVTLVVSDDGCGMNRQTVDRIFDPFFSTKFTGRGLGLAAVLGIVRSHNGAIRVYSEPGQGTSFKVLLPAVKNVMPQPKSRVITTSTWEAGGTLLLVDDEPSILALGQRMLERLGFQVLVACDGVEAIEIYQQNQERIVCVILDMTMPRMNGEETFHALRKIKPDLQIIIASGYSERDVVPHFLNQGLVGYIEKPYQMAALASKLHEVLDNFSDTKHMDK